MENKVPKIVKGRSAQYSTKVQPVNVLSDKGLNNDHEFFKNSAINDEDGMTKYSVDTNEKLKQEINLIYGGKVLWQH